jgi:hypothetical protein
MIHVRDLFDNEEVDRVKQDLIQECKAFGDIISIEIPRPKLNHSLSIDGE